MVTLEFNSRQCIPPCIFVYDIAESMQKICNVMGQMITTGREEDRTRVLESIAIMLYLEVSIVMVYIIHIAGIKAILFH